MKPMLPRILGVGVLALVALGLVWAGCRAVSDEPAAVQEVRDSGPDVTEETETRRAERLEVYQKIILWVTGKHSEITTDVVAGRLTLFEAAAGFRAVRQVRDKYLKPVSVSLPGKTEEEQLCWQVIVAVEQRLLDKPEQAAVVARLNKELQEHLGRYGSVHLPASPRLDPPF
jgi:hypothetical protein